MNATTLYKSEALDIRAVRYTGSDALKDGYLLCWNRDSTSYVDLKGAETADATVRNHNRFREVEKPAAGNLHNFAGVVLGNYSAVSGGQEIRIVIPRNQSVDLYTAQNCTSGSTFLCVQAGSYLAGPLGSGPVIGLAIQTVDRSSTNGLVQCVADMPNPLMPFAANGNGGPTIGVWESCPWDLLKRRPDLGIVFEEDFYAFPTLAQNVTGNVGAGWEAFTANVATSVVNFAAIQGGVANLSTGADNDEAALGSNTGPFKIDGSATGKLWFEARVRSSLVTSGSAFVGLLKAGDIATSVPIAADVLANANMVGWHVLAADPDEWNFGHSDDAPVEAANTAQVVAVDTWVNLGFVYTGGAAGLINAFVNGVAKSGTITNAVIAAAGFPNDVMLGPALAIRGSAAATRALLVDRIRIAQLF